MLLACELDIRDAASINTYLYLDKAMLAGLIRVCTSDQSTCTCCGNEHMTGWEMQRMHSCTFPSNRLQDLAIASLLLANKLTISGTLATVKFS